MSRLLDYARLVRLPNSFTAMADICLGALVAGALPERWPQFLLMLAASVSLYSSGMVWNDYFDLAQDEKERPRRPLPSGRISLVSAIVLGTILMSLGVVCAALGGVGDADFSWRPLSLSLALVAAILLYDGWLKKTYAGPAAMGSCRLLNVLLGLSVAGMEIGVWGVALALVVGVYITGITLFARTEARTSNPRLMLFGAALMLGALLLAVTVPSLAEYGGWNFEPSIFFPYLLAAFGFYLALPLARAIRKPTPSLVQKAVKRSILGLVLLDAVLATSLAGLVGLTIVLLLLPAHLFGRWLYVT